MDTIPRRLPLASPYRTLMTTLENRMVLPRIHPSYYHLLAILLSVLFLYVQTPWQKIALLGVVLTADWLDGATAKRYGEIQKAGYVIDTVTDRASEAFLFSAGAGTLLGKVFFLLWLVNCALTFYSLRSNKHTSLPLRFACLIVLILHWM